MSEKKQRWVYRHILHETGFVVKKSGRDIIYDSTGTRVIDTIAKPRILVNFVNHMLVVNESLARKFGLEPADLAKLIEMSPSYKRKFFCVESPEMVLTKEEAKKVEEDLAKKDSSGPKVVKGTRGRR